MKFHEWARSRHHGRPWGTICRARQPTSDRYDLAHRNLGSRRRVARVPHMLAMPGILAWAPPRDTRPLIARRHRRGMRIFATDREVSVFLLPSSPDALLPAETRSSVFMSVIGLP